MAIDYDKELAQAAKDNEVDLADVQFIMGRESGGAAGDSKATVTSPKGAVGPMQLMPAAAKDMGVDRTKPAENIQGGVGYYKRLLDKYDGDKRLAMTAYNWGPGNTDKWIAGDEKSGRKPSDPALLPEETLNYINAGAPLPEKAAGPNAYKFTMPDGSAIVIKAPSFDAAQKGLKIQIAGKRHEADMQAFGARLDMSPIPLTPKEQSQDQMRAATLASTPERDRARVEAAGDTYTGLRKAKAAGVDIDTGMDASTRVKIGLLSDSPEAQRAAMEYYAAEDLKKAGVKLPDGVPAVFRDDSTGQLAYWRATEDGKIRPTLANAPGIDAGDFAEFSPTAVSAVTEGTSAAAGAFVGAAGGPAGAIAGAAAVGGYAAAASTHARVATAKLLGVPDEIADKIGNDEALKNALIVGGSEFLFPVAIGVTRAVRNTGRFIKAGDSERLSMLKAALDKVRISQKAIKESTGVEITPTFGGATMDAEVAQQQVNLRSRSTGERGARLSQQDVERRQAAADSVKKLTDNAVDVGPRLDTRVPAEDIGAVVQSTVKKPSADVRQSVTRTAVEADEAAIAANQNKRRITDARAAIDDTLARQDELGRTEVFAGLRDDVAAAESDAIANVREGQAIFDNHVEFDPVTHRSNVLLDNPQGSPISRAVADLDAQGQEALSRSLAASKQSLVKDAGFTPEAAEGEAAMKSLADEHLDVYQLDVLRSHLLTSQDPNAPKLVAAIDEQIGEGTYRRASTNRPIPKKGTDVKDALMGLQQMRKVHKDTFDEKSIRDMLKQNESGEFELTPSQVANFVLDPKKPQVTKRVMQIIGNNPEKQAMLLEELERMHRAAAYPGGKYSAQGNARFLRDYQDQLTVLNNAQPTGNMKSVRATEEAMAARQRGHDGAFVRNVEETAALAKRARNRADNVRDALSRTYGRKLAADEVYSGNLAKDMMSDRLTTDQAAKIVSRLDQLHPALANEVKDKIGQWVTNKLITRAGNDTNAVALERLLKENGPKLAKIFGQKYVDNLEHMSILLGGEEFIKMVKPSAKEILPFAINMTRTLFGPLSKIQREITAVGRAKTRTQEWMLDRMLADPERLDEYVKLARATPDERVRRAAALGIPASAVAQSSDAAKDAQPASPSVKLLREVNAQRRP